MKKICLFFCVMFLISLEMKKGYCKFIMKMDWMFKKTFNVSFSMLMDKFSLLFAYCLLLIVFSVFSFSSIYMKKEAFFSRFKMLVVLFVISMLFLIFIPDLMFTLMGWDGLGLVSFLLMIYYLSGKSFSAGLKTYMMNRLGDGFFLVGFGMLILQSNWLLSSLENFIPFLVFFMLGCFTKSAQFPFSSWLPDAMAAPTPVSALVHSSTLVTAGIFLLIRFYSCLDGTFFVFIGCIGFWTMFIASLSACLEYDSKKMMAFSTLSQLGLMVVSISLGLMNFAFFHLLTHAMFKALLFITSGYKIFKANHFQDNRIIKSLFSISFFKNFVMQVCILSLMGFPFLAGFFSKDSVIEGSFWVWNKFFFFSFFVCLPLTSFYGFRLLYNTSNLVWQKTLSKKEYSFDFGSVIFLLIITFFTGAQFSSLSNFMNMKIMSIFSEKISLLMLLFLGWVVATKLEKKISFFFISELSFLKTFKGSFFLSSISEKVFFVFKTLDFGLNKSMVNFLNTSIKNFSQILKEMSLFFKSLKKIFMKIFFVFCFLVLLLA